MQMHVGTIEKRVALRQHGDGAAGVEMPGDAAGGLLVEGRDGGLVVAMLPVDFGGDRIDERQLDQVVAEMRAGDGFRVAVGAALGEMRHHVGLLQRAHRLQRHQFGVAGTRADAVEAAFCGSVHRPGLASALMAAAVMALPPMRPRTMA